MTNDRHIIDLRDMPLFYEELGEVELPEVESIEGVHYIDSLSRRPQTSKPKRRLKPWFWTGSAVVATGLIAKAVYGHHTVVYRPITESSKVVKSSAIVATPATAKPAPTLLYVNQVASLRLHSTPEFIDANVIGSVPTGQGIELITVVDASWDYVSWNGTKGYLSRAYLTTAPTH